jgi:Helicase conserved C-terminal domain/WYL domain
MSTLAQWLALRSQDDLAEILVRRPEVVAGQPPRNLGDLAARLQTQHSLAALMRELPQPCLELLETLLVYGPMSTAEIATTLRVADDDATLSGCLDVLRMWVAAWDYEDQWHVSGSLKSLLPTPLQLGSPMAELLVTRTVEDLRARANALEVAAGRTKTAIIEDLTTFFANPASVRALVQDAPSAQRELIMEASWTNPMLQAPGAYLYTGRPDPALSWLLTHSLVVADWQRMIVPREVALAVRGDDWHPPFTTAPTPVVRPVGRADVDRDAAAAAQQAMSGLTTLVDTAGETAIAILRAGGVGVKEVRRLAKAVGGDDASARLYLEIAHAAGWLDVDDDVLVPTERYDDWIELPAAEKLTALLNTWCDLSVAPLIEERPDDVKVPATLAPDSYGTIAAELRRDVIQSLAVDGAIDPDSLVATVAWRRPVYSRLLTDPALAVKPLLAEAHLVGVAGRNALSALGQALLDGAVGTVAAKFVNAAASTAIFQADLTIVVTGSPSPHLSELLDSVAEPESRGAAVTWRASANSVRRALDAGRTADDLVASLRDVAANGALPQPLEYLIADVARRHGDVRVRSVGCVLRSDDPSLLAEIAASRELSALRLSQIAPTVLTSHEPADYTLARLRMAGFAPVGEDADGTPILDRPRRRRAPRTMTPQSWVRASTAPEPADVARRLLTTPLPAVNPMLYLVPEPRSSTLDLLRRNAGHLSEPELRLLASGLDTEHPIWISYTTGDGESSSRVIDPLELAGSVLVAHCHLRDDERHFLLKRINEVRPD